MGLTTTAAAPPKPMKTSLHHVANNAAEMKVFRREYVCYVFAQKSKQKIDTVGNFTDIYILMVELDSCSIGLFLHRRGGKMRLQPPSFSLVHLVFAPHPRHTSLKDQRAWFISDIRSGLGCYQQLVSAVEYFSVGRVLQRKRNTHTWEVYCGPQNAYCSRLWPLLWVMLTRPQQVERKLLAFCTAIFPWLSPSHATHLHWLPCLPVSVEAADDVRDIWSSILHIVCLPPFTSARRDSLFWQREIDVGVDHDVQTVFRRVVSAKKIYPYTGTDSRRRATLSA